MNSPRPLVWSFVCALALVGCGLFAGEPARNAADTVLDPGKVAADARRYSVKACAAYKSAAVLEPKLARPEADRACQAVEGVCADPAALAPSRE